MVMTMHVFVLFRTHVFKPLCIHSNSIQPLRLTLDQFSSIWSKSIDRKVVSELGEGAGAQNPKKICGSLLDSIQAELSANLKNRKQTEIVSLLEVMDALTSNRLGEWFINWISTLVPTTKSQIIERLTFLSKAICQLFTEWAKLYRTSPERKFAADFTDYKEILNAPGLYYLVNANITSTKYTGSKSTKQFQPISAVAMAAATVRHRNIINKIEALIASNYSNNNDKGGKGYNSKYQYAEQAEPVRLCKTCSQDDTTISIDQKYVQTRCSEGCVLSFHTRCYYNCQPSLDEDDVPCINTTPCSGQIYRVVLKQHTNVLNILFGDPDSRPEDDSIDDDVEDMNEVDDRDAHQRAADQIQRARAGRLAFLGVAKNVIHKVERYALGEDGLLLYKDQTKRMELKKIREEKRLRDEERRAEAEKKKRDEEDEKKRKEEEEKKRKESSVASQSNGQSNTPSNSSSSAGTSTSNNSSTSASSSKKPFTFEVVVPLVKQPGEPTTPILNPSKPSNSSSSVIPPSSSSRLKNPFSALNLDESPTNNGEPIKPKSAQVVRNYWADGPDPIKNEYKPSLDEDDDSLFPITVKKVKGRKGGGGVKGSNIAPSIDEDAQLRAAIAASMTEANSSSPPLQPMKSSLSEKLFPNMAHKFQSAEEFPSLAATVKSAAYSNGPSSKLSQAPALPSSYSSSSSSPSLSLVNSVTSSPGIPATQSNLSQVPSMASISHAHRREGEEMDDLLAPPDHYQSERDEEGAHSHELEGRTHSPPQSSMTPAAAVSSSSSIATANKQTSYQLLLPNFAVRLEAIPIQPVKHRPRFQTPVQTHTSAITQQQSQPRSIASTVSSSVTTGTARSDERPSLPTPQVHVAQASSSVSASSSSSSNPIGYSSGHILPPPTRSPTPTPTPALAPTLAPTPTLDSTLTTSTATSQPTPTPTLVVKETMSSVASSSRPPNDSPAPLSSVPSPTPSAISTVSGSSSSIGMAAPPLTPSSSSSSSFASLPSTIPKIDLIDYVASSPVPTRILLLRHLPSYVTIPMLGGEFRSFSSLGARIQVRMFYTLAHGLTGIVIFNSIESARSASASMNGRNYEIEIGADSQTIRWQVETLYAKQPVQLHKPPIATIRMIEDEYFF